MNAKQSERPDNCWPPGNDWVPSDRVCECGSLMWKRGWWDDPPECGGACIGTWYECGDCGDYDSD